MKKATPKKAAAKRKPKLPALGVNVDFPQEGEAVSSGHYAVRVAADGASEVQVSVDGKEWRPCREAVGFFWLDWTPEPAGRRVAEARARRGKGRWVKSAPRSFEVLPA